MSSSKASMALSPSTSTTTTALSTPHKLKGYLQVKHNQHQATKSRTRLLRKVSFTFIFFALFDAADGSSSSNDPMGPMSVKEKREYTEKSSATTWGPLEA